jgi:Ca-activated chloride channel homolog
VIFAEPIFLRLGGAFVLLVLLGLWSQGRRRRRLAEFFGGKKAATRISRLNLYRAPLERVLLLVAAVMAIAAAAADPRWVLPEPETQPVPTPEPELIVALDVSVSMQGTDVPPTRLARGVEVINELMTNLEDTKIGLILFAGEPYPLTPPTADHRVIQYFLSGISPTIASAHDPGSLLSRGIQGAAELFVAADDSIPVGQRGILLIGDGEAGEPEASVLSAVREANDQGISVHAIGIGTAAGSSLVMPAAEFQLSGAVFDEAGNPVISRFREARLRQVAEAGGGAYARFDDAAQLRDLVAAISGPVAATSNALTGPEQALLRESVDPAFLFMSIALMCLLFESLLDVQLRMRSLSRVRRAA